MPQKKESDYFKRHADDGRGGQSFFDRHKSAEFQDLPEDKYPRSYTKRGKMALAKAIGRHPEEAPHGAPGWEQSQVLHGSGFGTPSKAQFAEGLIHREGQELISKRDRKKRESKK